MPVIEATSSSAATTMATRRTRMKPMRGSWGIRVRGKIFMFWFLPSDGQGLELLAARIDQHGKRTRHGDRGEHRGDDADHHGHRKALEWTGTERIQGHAGQDGGEVGVQDGARRLLVAAHDG